MDSAGAGYGQLSDLCENGIEPTSSIKCGERLD
jgi:hypothetical protein